MGMHFVCRLRAAADLLYLYKGAPTGQKGRPKKYTGKIDIDNIDKDYFNLPEKYRKVDLGNIVLIG